jgi:Predicted hydrolases or acyltransferases (alpha/beta hydrolase superfamily)
MGISKAHVLGFSDGGNTALLFALKYPDMVDRLILNGANLYPTGMTWADLRSICIRYAAAAFRSLFDRKAVREKELLGLMARQPYIRAGALSALSMPVLVIAGDHDMVRTSHTRKIAAAIPNAALCLLKGDHFISRKNSAVFNQTVLEFLRQTNN